MDISRDNLIMLRKDRGWSQSRLAKLSGLGERTIQRIEKEGVCSLESAMALASVFEVSPKDLQGNNKVESEVIIPDHKVNWGGLIGIGVLIVCAGVVIELTSKYATWEMISFALVFGLVIVLSFITHGVKKTVDCLCATSWLAIYPTNASAVTEKIILLNLFVRHSYIIGFISSLVTALTIINLTDVEADHFFDYVTYSVRPLVYATLLAEIWFRPLKNHLEALLQTSEQTALEK